MTWMKNRNVGVMAHDGYFTCHLGYPVGPSYLIKHSPAIARKVQLDVDVVKSINFKESRVPGILWGWASSDQLKAFRANTEVFQRRNSASRLQHQLLPEGQLIFFLVR